MRHEFTYEELCGLDKITIRTEDGLKELTEEEASAMLQMRQHFALHTREESRPKLRYRLNPFCRLLLRWPYKFMSIQEFRDL
jgi:hypothetical protein